jgi:hypothetical protein
VDSIALHDSMGVLRTVFADPSICKVFKLRICELQCLLFYTNMKSVLLVAVRCKDQKIKGFY